MKTFKKVRKYNTECSKDATIVSRDIDKDYYEDEVGKKYNKQEIAEEIYKNIKNKKKFKLDNFDWSIYDGGIGSIDTYISGTIYNETQTY